MHKGLYSDIDVVVCLDIIETHKTYEIMEKRDGEPVRWKKNTRKETKYTPATRATKETGTYQVDIAYC